MKDRGPVILYYAVWHTKAGGYGFEVMSIEDVKAHMQKYSKSAGSSFSPWTTNFDAMAKKTVLKQALKYAPIKSDFVRAVAQDGTIKKGIEVNMADMPDETVIEAEAEEVPQNVNTETGEVKPTDDEILAASLDEK